MECTIQLLYITNCNELISKGDTCNEDMNSQDLLQQMHLCLCVYKMLYNIVYYLLALCYNNIVKNILTLQHKDLMKIEILQ